MQHTNEHRSDELPTLAEAFEHIQLPVQLTVIDFSKPYVEGHSARKLSSAHPRLQRI